MPEFIFGREEELQALRRRFRKRKPFLLHGPSGVGKTFLVRRILREFPGVLYSSESPSAQAVFRNLAVSLLAAPDPGLLRAFGSSGGEGIERKSALALKGLVMDALHAGHYCAVLDHLRRPAYSCAAAVREIMGWGNTPVVALARSPHMEDLGFLHAFYPDRSDRLELRNFPPPLAQRFAEEAVRRAGLSAQNMSEFLQRVLVFSQGNPGAILSMLEMAKHPKYRSAEHIKITPLYVDFRLNWKPAGVR